MDQEFVADKYRFLAGGGEMGLLTRAMNWSDTAVGDISTWPQSLRTILNVLLNSKFPMFLWWGPELICFYNDAYRPSLGLNGKHPGILGMPAIKAWPEIWDVIKPLIDQVLEDGQSTWTEDQLIPIYRNGKLDDVYWTYSYSPVKDESGKVSAVLVTCVETTDKILAYKKLEESREQLEFAIQAADLGTWDINPSTNKFISNKKLKEWFELPDNEEIDLHIAISQVAEKDREHVLSAIQAALNDEAEGKYDLEFRVIHPVSGKETILQAKGRAWFNQSGIAYRLNGTLQDVSVEAMQRIREQDREREFRNIIKQAPLGITIFRGPDYVVESANENYLQLVGRTEEQFVGKPLFDALPEVKETVKPLIDSVYNTGEPFYATEFPVTLNRYGKKDLSYFNLVYHPIKEENGLISGIIVVTSEVTSLVNSKHSIANSEKQFRLMVMESPIPMTILRGKDFIIEIANKAMFEQIWRKKEEDTPGKSILEVFPELSEQKFPALLTEVYTTGKLYKETEAIAHIKGDDEMKKFYLDFEYAPLIEADNSITGVIITVNDVTEKVEARRQVEESEKRFSNVANSAPVLIWMSGTDKACNFFNKAWLDFTGCSMEASLGNGWMSSVHPDDLQRCYDVYASSFDRREGFYMEYRLCRHDGAYRWISDNGVPRFSGEGVFEGYIGACMDIHERVVYREKLKEDEERLNIIIEASDLATWEYNIQADTIIYSERYLKILGHQNGTILTNDEIWGQVHKEDRAQVEQEFQAAYKNGVLYYVCRVITKDNTLRWIEGRGRVFYDELNKPLKLIGTTRDISEEKNYQHKLEEREQKFRLLADSMPQLVWTSDAQGKLNYFNQSVFQYAGLTPGQLANDGWLDIVHPDEREENSQRWAHSIETGEDFIFEHRFRKFDGTYRWQLSRAKPQRDSAGRIQMWVGTSTDIQIQKTFTQELEKQVQERTAELEMKNKELQSMNAELQSFAYVSSHDLQEPLRKIQVFTAMILQNDKDNLSDTGKDYFRRMQKAAARMQTLIEDLLTYSRTNITERNFEKVDLNKLLEEVKTDLKEDIVQKQAVIEATDLCEATVIPFQFRQLLNNLIGNALKFSQQGQKPYIQVTSTIETGKKASNSERQYCHVTIKDNGIGFDPQYKERIFEVFQRLHGKTEYKGTGIGLAIVKKIVENHNGLITATSEPDKGASFDIFIPLDPIVTTSNNDQ